MSSQDLSMPGQAAFLWLATTPETGFPALQDGLAVGRDEAGRVHRLSAVCSHMGCIVHWNAAEKSWDCPCHGSRFDIEGRVIHGPAIHPLQKK